MLINGYINFFNINKCGLYKYVTPNPFGCTAAQAFSLIQDWKSTVDFENTLPWDTKKNKEKMYCHEIFHDATTGDFLVTLWKSDADSTGKTIGIVPGETEVLSREDNHKGKPVIWGKPCYYWIIPSLEAVASIKFDHSRCDTSLFQDWVTQVINNRIDIPNTTKRITEHNYVQIIQNDESGNIDHAAPKLHFRFDVSMMSLDTSDSRLTELAAKVTHLVKREQISLSIKDERAEWLKLFDRFGVPYASAKDKKQIRNLEIRVEAKPTPAEIREIIDAYARENNNDASTFTNVGFQTENGICWADKYRLTDNISVDDEGKHILSATHLFMHLNGKRDGILAPIKKEAIKALQAAEA